MTISTCKFSDRSRLKRCLLIVLVAVCAESISIRLTNPQFAFRHPPPHKIHVSVAQIEFNQPRQSVEIVIRVFTDDLENALSQHAKRPVKIDPAVASKNKETGQLVSAYLRDRFELKSKAGRPVKLNWVGLEGQMDMFWLYFEGKLPGGLEGTQVKNKIFCELFDDQVNIVNARHRGKQFGLMFESKDDFKLIIGRDGSNNATRPDKKM